MKDGKRNRETNRDAWRSDKSKERDVLNPLGNNAFHKNELCFFARQDWFYMPLLPHVASVLCWILGNLILAWKTSVIKRCPINYQSSILACETDCLRQGWQKFMVTKITRGSANHIEDDY